MIDRPAVLVKIENTAAARPQSGLDDADVVFEELVEGGVTRFLAVFHSVTPEAVGPIRSGRLVDVGLGPPFNGLFVFSGARDEVLAALRRTGMPLQGEDGSTLYRNRSRSAPHNLYADGEALFDAAMAIDRLEPPEVPWEFRHDAPPGGHPAEQVDIVMSRVATTGWQFDDAIGVYRRSQNGTPFTVAGDGVVGAANVIVLGVNVGLGGCCDTSGSRYVSVQTEGEGRALIARDGRLYEARWTKPNAADHYRFTTPDGAPFPLKPGPSWIHLAPVENLPAAVPAASPSPSGSP